MTEPQTRGVPPRLEPEVLAKAGEGWSTRRIAEWLAAEHAVSVGHNAVARILRARREERADVTRAVVREVLGKTVTRDLDVLEKHLGKLDRLADRLEASNDVEHYLPTVEQLRKVVDTRLKYSGAAEPEDPLRDLKELGDRVLRRLVPELAEGEAEGALGGPVPEGEGGP